MKNLLEMVCFLVGYRVAYAHGILVALRQAAAKLPSTLEFITRASPPRLGNMLITPELPPAELSASTSQIIEATA